MKRLVIFIISLCLVLLCGCAKKENNTTIPQENKEKELIGVWLTFSEIKALCSGSEGFDAAFNEVIKNCKTLGINTVFLQVRPFCDAIYKSQYFPQSDYIAGEDEDVLKKAIEIAKASDISIHAWINPYRVSTNTTPETLAKSNPFYTDGVGFETESAARPLSEYAGPSGYRQGLGSVPQARRHEDPASLRL